MSPEQKTVMISNMSDAEFVNLVLSDQPHNFLAVQAAERLAAVLDASEAGESDGSNSRG